MIKSFFKKIYIKLLNGEAYINFLRKCGVIIGNNCEIYKNVDFGSEPYLIKMGNHVRITNGVRFITHDGGVWVFRENTHKNIDVFGPIIIGNNVHIGMNSIIMPGVKIGNNCVIGAGAVVTKNIPDDSIAAGVPAKVIKSLAEYEKSTLMKSDDTKSLNNIDKKSYLLKKFFG
ncbi:acyltransferase [Streptococcus parasuis]|uniref:acyltransferase n=1 Tax=Streptococcus parasuis TaxID=1501662 RepID=UPI004062E503